MGEEKRYCDGAIWERFGYHGCSNRGKINEGGKWWCKIHVPSTVTARADKRQKKWDAEWAETQRQCERATKINDAQASVIKIATEYCHGEATRGALERTVNYLEEVLAQ